MTPVLRKVAIHHGFSHRVLRLSRRANPYGAGYNGSKASPSSNKGTDRFCPPARKFWPPKMGAFFSILVPGRLLVPG